MNLVLVKFIQLLNAEEGRIVLVHQTTDLLMHDQIDIVSVQLVNFHAVQVCS
jgi:hypothetical protein